jgi:4-amino-4-deoxy-L-arabinose transferase-like glycosyltransferase
MKPFARRHWPVFAATFVFWLTTAILLVISLQKNSGHLAYALDDAYIHMAMAKNCALHDIWGITRHGFSSATSSPLWTFLLFSTYVLFGVNEVSPFILNVLFGTAAMVV